MRQYQATYRILMCLCSISWLLKAQTKHQVGFVTDNDLYVSVYLDGYYTNGLKLYYKNVQTSHYRSYHKKIKTFSLTQNIYNPQVSNVPFVYIQERPYAGYLYGDYATQFIGNNNLLTLGLSLGIVGQQSGAEWSQNFIHQFYNIKPSKGWDTQVKQKIAFGVFTNYIHQVFYKTNSPVDVSWINKVNLNTVVGNMSSGVGVRVNLLKHALNPLSNSSFYRTALLTKQENWTKETYIGVKSYVTYQINDATVTGDLMQNPPQKAFHLQPWIWHNNFGIYWNLKHWNISYHQIFETKNTREISKKWIRYGSIQLAYKF